MPDSSTLEITPPEHPALDYAFLRAEGIRYLERVIGHLWTDYNAHDPGITILELLCYAITDLAHRASYDVADMVAGGGKAAVDSLYSAATILPTEPVTLVDLRKLIFDVEGVKNAWVEEVVEPKPPLHYDEGERQLRFSAGPPYTSPVYRRGVHRVLIEKSSTSDVDSTKLIDDVAHRLSACRPLCSDFEAIEVLGAQLVQVDATVEIGPVDDAERVLLDIFDVLAEHISPSVRFATLSETVAAGKRSDQIFDGPHLRHGFLETSALDRMSRKDALYTSDLIREIMSVRGVRTVRAITLSSSTKHDSWKLPLNPREAPRLDTQRSSIALVKHGLTARLDVSAKFEERQRNQASQPVSSGESDFAVPLGRDRDAARYHSIQHQFPAIYGIGSAGLRESVSDRRKAQAKQLKAYLLLFDQLLANYFAQVANASSLFSFHGGSDARSYFVQLIDDPSLGLAEIRTQSSKAQLDLLRELAEGEPPVSTLSGRRNRFLNHLMARFAEQFSDYALVLLERLGDGGDIVSDKQAFLQRYPRISSARGTGFDLLSPPGATNRSGLEERIARMLGFSPARNERIILIEHLLLSPIDNDELPQGEREYQQIPILSEPYTKDPYSLQISVVLPDWPARLASDSELRVLVERTVREETPAHITPYVHWVNEDDWKSIDATDKAWRDAQRGYRSGKLGIASDLAADHFALRDTRDRLIDLLRIGETYPLRDLPVLDERLTVPYGQPARIPIEHSQVGVAYELRSDQDDTLIMREVDGQLVPARDEGNGETTFLLTPAMQEDTTYNILARKIATGNEVYLQQQATVKVGLDVTLRARILADFLDPVSGSQADTDARITDYGAALQVQIDQSQEGVDYHLCSVAGGVETRLSLDERGTHDDIVLLAVPATEDVDFRIRATKVFDPAEHRPTQTDLLDIILPLKVRARRDLAVSMKDSAIASFNEAAVVQLDGTQNSARYGLYIRSVLDRDFVANAGDRRVGTDVEGESRVEVNVPADARLWQDFEGFTPLGAAVNGTGETLLFPIDALTRDSVVLVRAEKDHQAQVSVTSAVPLQQPVLILVRPNPNPDLKLAVVMEGAKTTGTLEASDGEPGVYYYFSTELDGAPIGLPAYFHKTDDKNPKLNKGVGQLGIEVDFAVTRGTLRPATTPQERASTRPLTPLVDTAPLDAGTKLYIRAVKALTRVGIPLPKTAEITPVPEIVTDLQVGPTASSATVTVRASIVGEKYQLMQAGLPVSEVQDGDGADLTFTLDPLPADVTFTMVIHRLGDSEIPLARSVRIVVGAQ